MSDLAPIQPQPPAGLQFPDRTAMTEHSVMSSLDIKLKMTIQRLKELQDKADSIAEENDGFLQGETPSDSSDNIDGIHSRVVKLLETLPQDIEKYWRLKSRENVRNAQQQFSQVSAMNERNRQANINYATQLEAAKTSQKEELKSRDQFIQKLLLERAAKELQNEETTQALRQQVAQLQSHIAQMGGTGGMLAGQQVGPPVLHQNGQLSGPIYNQLFQGGQQ